METFDKTVKPDYTCDNFSGDCIWINKVGRAEISARESYGVQPPIAPTNSGHQLLFQLNGIAAIASRCVPFWMIVSMMPPPPNDPLSYPIGSGPSATNLIAGAQWSPGYGQPGIYSSRHVVVHSTFASAGIEQSTDADATQFSQSIYQFADAVQQPLYSPIVSSAYFDPSTEQNDYITYVPDFTDCASSLPEDGNLDNQLYGTTTMVIVMEVYQAIP
jgi:hypothetical protein